MRTHGSSYRRLSTTQLSVHLLVFLISKDTTKIGYFYVVTYRFFSVKKPQNSRFYFQEVLDSLDSTLTVAFETLQTGPRHNMSRTVSVVAISH